MIFFLKVAVVFKIISDEEISHGPMDLDMIVRYAKSESNWERAQTIVRDISWQRLRMRNEMFGHPLSPARREEIMEGKIQTWLMAISL